MTLGAAIFLAAIVAMLVLDRIPLSAYLHTDARRRRERKALERASRLAALPPTEARHAELTRLLGELELPGRDLERPTW